MFDFRYLTAQKNVSSISCISNAKNTFKVLHKLNYLMKNDKQIAFTELSFQPLSGKCVTIIQYLKLISWNIWIRILVFVGYFTDDQICNPNPDYDLKYRKIYLFFFKVNQIIMPTSQ